jgi:hypothetical protein
MNKIDGCSLLKLGIKLPMLKDFIERARKVIPNLPQK